MEDILKRLASGEILVADGAMGTMLMARGVDIKKGSEAINLNDQNILESIAGEYLDAGADIIQTNTKKNRIGTGLCLSLCRTIGENTQALW